MQVLIIFLSIFKVRQIWDEKFKFLTLSFIFSPLFIQSYHEYMH